MKDTASKFSSFQKKAFTCSYCHCKLDYSLDGGIRLQGGRVDPYDNEDNENTRYICVDCVIAALDASTFLANRSKAAGERKK